jgi:(p)ppGpp synthase/HD superfamily hydrolase
MDNLIEEAITAAVLAHHGQYDKVGESYILHCIRVMVSLAPDHEAMATGVLHDILEDTDYNEADLREEGFPENIIAAIRALTHRDGEMYDEYIMRVRENDLARAVKYADIKDNLSDGRSVLLDDKTRERLARKYMRALDLLGYGDKK